LLAGWDPIAGAISPAVTARNGDVVSFPAQADAVRGRGENGEERRSICLPITQEMHRHPPEDCAMITGRPIRPSRPESPRLAQQPFQQSAALTAPRPDDGGI